MLRKGKSFQARTQRWQLLVSGLKASDGFGHMAAEQLQLEQLLAEVRALEGQKNALRAQLLGITARLQEIMARGDMLRTRFGASLQAKFGPTSEALTRFGFKPRQAQRR